MPGSVAGRLAALRERMKGRGIALFLMQTSDFHGSEYIGGHFKAVEYFTGFTGSNATVAVMQDRAGLWTDGRYFIQADRQLKGSGVTLYRMGEEGVPEVKEYVKENLPAGGRIGFDGRAMDAKTGNAYRAIAAEKGGSLWTEEDLAGMAWEGRPTLSKEPVFLLQEQYSGRSLEEKLADVREQMGRMGAKAHLLASLEDIAWLLNVRGGDIRHVPVALSFLLIRAQDCVWYVQEGVLTEAQRRYFEERKVRLRPYGAVYADLEAFEEDSVLLSEKEVNYRIYHSIPGKRKKINAENPTKLLKAVKNPIEVENIKAAHVKDGVAFTKFMHWVKTRVGRERITERSAAAYLRERRREQAHFLEESFGTICAYGPNAAMMHYEATQESDAELEPKGFFLVDSGGHYLEGSTDITRTMAMGEATQEMRRHFTAVLRGNLQLASAKFLHGCRGVHLDILAREPLWEMELDYKCGTGHGVGYALNVHEGPNAFRWKWKEGIWESAVLEENMVTTDEPGLYLEGAYGIRIENELLCQKAGKNEYGQFMQFETITYAPIDLDAVEASELTKKERSLLNEYHKKVYGVLSPWLTDEERIWLKEYTREL